MPCISQLPANMSTTLLQCQQIYGGKYEVNAYLNPAPKSVYLSCQKIFQLSSYQYQGKSLWLRAWRCVSECKVVHFLTKEGCDGEG